MATISVDMEKKVHIRDIDELEITPTTVEHEGETFHFESVQYDDWGGKLHEEGLGFDLGTKHNPIVKIIWSSDELGPYYMASTAVLQARRACVVQFTDDSQLTGMYNPMAPAEKPVTYFSGTEVSKFLHKSIFEHLTVIGLVNGESRVTGALFCVPKRHIGDFIRFITSEEDRGMFAGINTFFKRKICSALRVSLIVAASGVEDMDMVIKAAALLPINFILEEIPVETPVNKTKDEEEKENEKENEKEKNDNVNRDIPEGKQEIPDDRARADYAAMDLNPKKFTTVKSAKSATLEIPVLVTTTRTTTTSPTTPTTTTTAPPTTPTTTTTSPTTTTTTTTTTSTTPNKASKSNFLSKFSSTFKKTPSSATSIPTSTAPKTSSLFAKFSSTFKKTSSFSSTSTSTPRTSSFFAKLSSPFKKVKRTTTTTTTIEDERIVDEEGFSIPVIAPTKIQTPAKKVK